MIIAVASGKGGTGKTTVATSLALSVADQGPQVLDCDVEEPDAALYLKPVLSDSQQVGVLVPSVDASKCTGCGRCAELCAWSALAVVDRRVLVFPELCHGCGSCVANCPEGAISEVLHVTGTVESGWAGPIGFAQGTLDVGEAMPGPIIRHLKRMHLEKSSGARVVILDAPPGTSCPVVDTMRGADYVLLVTEPTPFGLHDLRLAVEVARDQLGLPVGVVVNRDGVGDAGVDDYCAAEAIPILMRIPLDRRIAQATADGHALVEALPEYRPRFAELLQRILAEAAG